MALRFSHYLAAMGCAALMAGSGAASAQTARSGGNANAQAMQQMQQLASERTALQAENEKLKTELAEVKKDRDSLKTGQQTNDKRSRETASALAHSTSQREALEQELTQTKSKMQELIGKFRETAQKLHESETAEASAKRVLAGREHELAVCADHNEKLYHLNQEVLNRLDHEGTFTRIAEAEPFTKIKRIQLDNLVDDYHAHAQDQLITPPTGLSPAAAAPAVPSAAPAPPAAAPAADPTTH
jgi:chromosome segregation ATPase